MFFSYATVMDNKLVEVGDFGDLGVFPKAFEAVEFARLALEDVDKDVSVVDSHPLAVAQTHDTLLAMARLFLDGIDEPVGNAQDVGGGGAFADNKVLEGGFFEVAHVDDLQVARLAVLKTFDDNVY